MDRDLFFETFAISTRLYLSDPLDKALRRLSGAGFRWVELWADRVHLDPRVALDLAAVSRLMDELGIRAHSVHTPFEGLELGHPERCDRRSAGALIAGAMERASALGAKVAVVHPSSYQGPLEPSLQEASRRLVREIVEDALAAADRHGLRLALENMVAVGYPRFGTSVSDLTAAFPDPRVGLCLDVGHASVQGRDLSAEITAAGERLVSLHLHDNDGTGDQHLPPLRGRIDWAALDGALERAGYRGRRVLEVAHREGREDVLLQESSTLWQRWPSTAAA